MSLLLSAVTFVQVMEWIGYILVALLCLMFMVIVHEFGHYVVGRILGFKVDQFAVGFGPAILKYTNKKTGVLFALRCIPLGGYCAFHGEEDDEDEVQLSDAEQEMQTKINEIYATDEDGRQFVLVPEDDKKDEKTRKKRNRKTYLKKSDNFNDHAPWKRILVFFAGASFNFLSAVILVTIFFCAYGDYAPKIGVAHEFKEAGIEQVLQDGDVLLRVEGESLYSTLNPNDFAQKLNKYGDGVNVTILRNGEEVDLKLSKGTFDFVDQDGNNQTVVGFGMSIAGYERVKFDFIEAFGRSFVFIFKVIEILFVTIGGVITGALGVGESMGGTITAIGMIATISRQGFEMVLYAVCVLSSTLAIMNLLPIPALDGSHIVFTAIEWVRGKPMNRKIENIIHLVGLAFMFILAILLDVVHFVG